MRYNNFPTNFMLSVGLSSNSPSLSDNLIVTSIEETVTCSPLNQPQLTIHKQTYIDVRINHHLSYVFEVQDNTWQGQGLDSKSRMKHLFYMRND